MEKPDTTKKGHVIFETLKSPRHLIELARQRKREFLHIPLFVIFFAFIIFSSYRTISVIQAAGETRDSIKTIEKNFSKYTSGYKASGCRLKDNEKIKFSDDPADILACEEFFDEICSICGKTDKELALEEKANREYQIRVEREKEKARQAAALTRKRAAAPVPAAGNKVGDHWVCDKKNDKPRESKENHNGMHWDRECCLDPDEWPNPWCAY